MATNETVTTEPVIVLLTAPGRPRLAELSGSPLDGYDGIRRVHWTDEMSAAERTASLDAQLPGADALVVSPWFRDIPAFTGERWEKADRLKVIAGTFDHRFGHWLDVADANRRGVTVIDTSRSMTPTVAEFALAMILSVLRDIPAAVQLVREGDWKVRDHWDLPGFIDGDLTGRQVGLAGFGSINRRLAEFLVPFRCPMQTYDPFVPDDSLAAAGVARADSLVKLAAGSDIFVVGLPPTPATRGIINHAVIDALPRGSIFILVTRMAVVEQEALWNRLAAGDIRAAVDVYEPEPPPAAATFLQNPLLLPTPHIAGDTFHCHRQCFTTACADALAVLHGEQPVYPVTVRDEQLYEGKLGATGSSFHNERGPRRLVDTSDHP